MAGRGFAPKPADRRAGHSKDLVPVKVLPHLVVEQPELPDRAWPAQTVAWWRMWGESPLSGDFTANDWSELLDAALLHARIWGDGELKWLPELRLRTAKYGATPEDRARLRIQFAQANEAEVTSVTKTLTARQRFGSMQVESMDPDVAS